MAELAVTRRVPAYAVRWTAVFAGMAVGIALHLLLMAAGVALGFAVFDPAEAGAAREIPIVAAGWNAGSLLITAFIGGYVAARASGLRRSADGLLHGAVSWGATTLLYAVLATTVLGAVFGGLFSVLAPSVQTVADAGASGATGARGLPPEVVRAIRDGDRPAAVQALQDATGMSAEEAERYADIAFAALGKEGSVPTAATERAERAMDASAKATGWLSGAVALSLVAGLLGGAMGARGARRFARVIDSNVPTTVRVDPA